MPPHFTLHLPLLPSHSTFYLTSHSASHLTSHSTSHLTSHSTSHSTSHLTRHLPPSQLGTLNTPLFIPLHFLHLLTRSIHQFPLHFQTNIQASQTHLILLLFPTFHHIHKPLPNPLLILLQTSHHKIILPLPRTKFTTKISFQAHTRQTNEL